MHSNDFTWVTDRGGVLELASSLAGSSWHALDSESNSGFVYRERLCLLQLNVDGRLWLVDLLALEGGERALELLRSALESPDVTTFVHGGEFDVGCLKRDYGIALQGLWDSQQAASFLGWEKTGYGALVERICGVGLPKAYAHYDWGKRPLDDGPLLYALNDVSYLLQHIDLLFETGQVFDSRFGFGCPGDFGPKDRSAIFPNGHRCG